MIRDHELLRVVGRGAYGEVWMARSTLGTLRAVKVVRRADFQDDRPFDREFSGIQKYEPVSRAHPGLIDILQVGRNNEDGYFYYVMELADPWVEPAESSGQTSPAAEIPPANERGSSPSASPSTLDRPPGLFPPSLDAYMPRTLRQELRRRGRLPVEECIRLGLSLARALEHLHGSGLVHRDIKPSNLVFVGGELKLADIGLITDIGEARSVVGTEGYLPPEGGGTPEADVYSLGKVLYEMSTGLDRRQFPELPGDQGDPTEAVRLRELNEIVLEACARAPADRHPSARALREELERLRDGGSIVRRRRWQAVRRAAGPTVPWAVLAIVLALAGYGLIRRGAPTPATAPAEKASVFVLPFRTFDENVETSLDDAFGRTTDAFIDSLAAIEGVRRSPRRSGWVLCREEDLFASLARTNDMRHVLTGRQSTQGSNLRLSLKLFERASRTPVWSETFIASTNESVPLRRRALEGLTAALGLVPTDEEWREIEARITRNEEAARSFEQVARLCSESSGDREGTLESVRLAEQVVRLDPGYLRAEFWAAAQTLFLAFDRPPAETHPSHRRRMDAILAQDETDTAALDHRAGCDLVLDWNWKGFDYYHQRSFRLGTSRYQQLSKALWLRFHGELDRAREEQAAVYRRNDPDMAVHFHSAGALWFERRYREAIDVCTNCIAILPKATQAREILAQCLVDHGDYGDALRLLERELTVNRSPRMVGLEGYALARRGRTAEARQVLDELLALGRVNLYTPPYVVARVHVALGEREPALDWLEQAERDRAFELIYPDFAGLRTDPAWDDLQDHPRFQALLKKVGLDRWPVPITPLAD